MKKIFVIIIGVILFTSCNKEKEVDVIYQFTANVVLSDVVKSFKNLDGSELYQNGATLWGSDAAMMLFNIYDASGEIVDTEEITLSDFAERPVINKSLKEGDYTVVIVAYLKNTGGDWWTFENKGKLHDFKIRIDETPYIEMGRETQIGSVLGVLKQNITINKSETFQLTVPSSIGQLMLNFTDLHLSGINWVLFGVKTWNDYYSVGESKGYLLDLLNNGEVFELEKSTSSSNVIALLYYFPTSKFDIIWEGYDINENFVKEGVLPSSALTPTNTKILNINTNTGQVSTETKAASISTGYNIQNKIGQKSISKKK